MKLKAREKKENVNDNLLATEEVQEKHCSHIKHQDTRDIIIHNNIMPKKRDINQMLLCRQYYYDY